MKNRRILTLFVALSVFAVDLAAQSRGFFDGFGLTFGYVNSSYRTVDLVTEEPTSSGMLHGFYGGLSKDFTLLPGELYFQTGLNYIYQNDSRDEYNDILKVKLVGDREEHYLVLPLKLKYDLALMDNIGLIFDAGPKLLLGLSSNYYYRTRLADGTVLSSKYNLYNGEVKSNGDSPLFDLDKWMSESGMYPYGKLGRFDVMLGASVGAHFFDIIEVRLGYDWGLLNRYKKETADLYSMHRGQFTLTAGFRF